MSLDVYLTVTAGGTGEAEVFWRNITHNLGRMASKAGQLYEAMWCPEELNATKAGDLITPLEDGLGMLLARPSYYKKYNPENGWGDYEGLVEFVTAYLNACRAFPDAEVTVSR